MPIKLVALSQNISNGMTCQSIAINASDVKSETISICIALVTKHKNIAVTFCRTLSPYFEMSTYGAKKVNATTLKRSRYSFSR